MVNLAERHMSATGDQQGLRTPADGAPTVYGAGAATLGLPPQNLAHRLAPTEAEALRAGKPSVEEKQRCENMFLQHMMAQQARVLKQRAGTLQDWLATIVAALSLPDSYADSYAVPFWRTC